MKKQFKYPTSGPELSKIQFSDQLKNNVINKVNGEKYEANKHKKWKSRQKKIICIIAPLAVVFILFLASTYISPTMANVAAKIPYFHWFIQQQDSKDEIIAQIDTVLKENELQMSSLDLSIPNKEITIWVPLSKSELQEQKTQLTKDLQESLRDNNFGKYEIMLKREEPNHSHNEKLSEEDIQNQKDSKELQKKIQQYLDTHDFVTAFPIRVSINSKMKDIYISLPKTDHRKAELRKNIEEISKEYGTFDIRITQVNMTAREQEIRWEKNNIMGILAQGLMDNKKFEVKGFSYSFHPLPLQIKIKLSVHSSDKIAKELASKIEEEIELFIQTDEITKDVRNDPYQVTILSKDKKVLNK